MPGSLPLDKVAPLLCAGVTLYSPLRHWNAGPGKKVAIVGMGGLGHVGVKLAHALGAEVTALSRTLSKQDDGLEFGADHYYATSDPATFDKLAGKFDLILNTVSSGLDIGQYVNLLAVDGTLVMLGAPSESLTLPAMPLIAGRRSIAGSANGGIPITQEMLDFCAEHGVLPETELIDGASAGVLNAIARALQLNDAEREYLFDLAQAAPAAATRTPKPAQQSVRTSVQRVLDTMTAPAVVYNARQDIIAANLLGRALYSAHFDTDGTPNIARFVFLDPRARDFYVDWPLARLMTAAMLRLEAGRDPLSIDLTALIGELSTRSPQFRQDWAAHDVHQHSTGVKSFRHSDIGVIEVAFDVFEIPGETGLQVVTYTAAPGTESAEKFALLPSWAATHDSQPRQRHTATK